jgi:hypothetical protein
VIDARLDGHEIIVTHNFDRELIVQTFPNAAIIQIYPYTHIGNVLYNICHKKLDVKLENLVDNHFINIDIWYQNIQQQRPVTTCVDFWALREKFSIEEMLGYTLNATQLGIFENYWQQQLQYELDLPSNLMTIKELLEFWQIRDRPTPWFMAWVIFVFEKLHGFSQSNRLWSIDDASILQSWESLCYIEDHYR